jgi:hypothetical protein
VHLPVHRCKNLKQKKKSSEAIEQVPLHSVRVVVCAVSMLHVSFLPLSATAQGELCLPE